MSDCYCWCCCCCYYCCSLLLFLSQEYDYSLAECEHEDRSADKVFGDDTDEDRSDEECMMTHDSSDVADSTVAVVVVVVVAIVVD